MINDQKEWRSEALDNINKMNKLSTKKRQKKGGERNAKERDESSIPFFDSIKEKGHIYGDTEEHGKATQGFIKELNAIDHQIKSIFFELKN